MKVKPVYRRSKKWISIKDIAIGTRYVAGIDKDNGVHIVYLTK